MSLSQTMSPLAPDARPAPLRLALGVLLVVALSACGPKEAAAQPGPGAEPAATTQPEIGRAHVCTPVTNAHLVCRPLLEQKNPHRAYAHRQNERAHSYTPITNSHLPST